MKIFLFVRHTSTQDLYPLNEPPELILSQSRNYTMNSNSNMTPGGMNGTSNFAYLNTKIAFDPDANQDPFRTSYSQNNYNQSSNMDDFHGTPSNLNMLRSSINTPNTMRNSMNYNGVDTEEEFQGDCAVSLWDPSQVKKWLIFCHLGEFAG